jgi:predicted transcriptional regulator
MSNTITIELCAEDRARLDRLADALERKACDKCVASALEYSKAVHETKAEPDPVQEALAETLSKVSDPVEAPKNATEATETSTQPTAPLEEEKPTDEEPVAPTPTRVVDRAELRAKVIELSAKGFKEQTRDIVRSYAQTVTAVPEDKITECYEKLEALEG